MEFEFQKSACPCLETVLREVQNVEQTQEIKLSDGMPDVGRVLAAWGQTILRGKEWRSDSVSFSGGMMVWILYAPEDGSEERCIDGWIPFQMKWDLPERTEEGSIRIQCLTRFVDARSVSARKLMVRVGAAAMAEACVPKTAEIAAPAEPIEGVELLTSSYPVRMPREAGEKAFALDEELTLPESSPLPEKLVYYCLHPRGERRKRCFPTRWCSGETGTCTCFTAPRRDSSTDGTLSCPSPSWQTCPGNTAATPRRTFC